MAMSMAYGQEEGVQREQITWDVGGMLD